MEELREEETECSLMTFARNELDIKKVKDYNISIALNRVVLYLSYLK